MGLRIIASVVLLLSVLFAPFWLTVLLAVVFMLYFPLFAEGIFLFLLSDLLYGVSVSKFFGVTYASVIIGIVIFFLAQFIRRETKFYRNKL